MGRKKAIVRDELYSCHVQAKVTPAVFRRLQETQQSSDCHSVSELVRRILSRERITTLVRDTTLDVAMEEFIRLRKELHWIGHNINQITHHFHSSAFPKDKLFYALKAMDEYQKVQLHVDTLLNRITELGKKWLQK